MKKMPARFPLIPPRSCAATATPSRFKAQAQIIHDDCVCKWGAAVRLLLHHVDQKIYCIYLFELFKTLSRPDIVQRHQLQSDPRDF